MVRLFFLSVNFTLMNSTAVLLGYLFLYEQYLRPMLETVWEVLTMQAQQAWGVSQQEQRA
jgi:hypothetical protein